MKIIYSLILIFLSVSARNHKLRKGGEEESKSNDEFNFVFISDIHFDPFYKFHWENGKPGERGNTCQFRKDKKEQMKKLNEVTLSEEENAKLEENYYGVYNCNSNDKLLQALVEEIERIKPKKIIFLGDMVAHGIDNFEQRKEVISFIQSKFTYLKSKINNLEVYVAVGNNDLNAKYNFPKNEEEYEQEMQLLFQNTKVTEGTKAPMFPFYSVWMEDVQFEFIFLFTTLYGVDHKGKEVPKYAKDFIIEQKNFLEDKLANLHKEKKKAIICYHIPVHATFERSHNSMETNWDIEFRNWLDLLLKKFSDTVYLNFSGHTHRADLHTMLDSNENPYFSVINMPSLTPVKFNNPGFAVAKFSQRKLEKLEYRFLPLNETKTKVGNPFSIKVNLNTFKTENEGEGNGLDKIAIKKLLDNIYSTLVNARKFVLFKEGNANQIDDKKRRVVDREDFFYLNHACSSYSLNFDYKKDELDNVTCLYPLRRMSIYQFNEMIKSYYEKPASSEKPKRLKKKSK